MSTFVSETWRGASFGLRAAILANGTVLPYGLIEHELVDFTLVKLEHRWGPLVAADLLAAAWAVLKLRDAEAMLTRIKQVGYETGLAGGMVLTVDCVPLSQLEGLVLNAALRSAARALFGVAISVHTPEIGSGAGRMGRVDVLRSFPFVGPPKDLPWKQELGRFVAEQTRSATFQDGAGESLQLA